MWTNALISFAVAVVMVIVFVFGFVFGMIWVACMDVAPEYHDCDEYLEFLEGNPAFTFKCSKCNKYY